MNFTLIDIWISFSPNMESCVRLFLFLPALKIATNPYVYWQLILRMFLKVFKIPASVLYFYKCIFACRGGFYISVMTNIFAIVLPLVYWPIFMWMFSRQNLQNGKFSTSGDPHLLMFCKQNRFLPVVIHIC